MLFHLDDEVEIAQKELEALENRKCGRFRRIGKDRSTSEGKGGERKIRISELRRWGEKSEKDIL